VDAVVLATGYCYSFPFLDEGLLGMCFEGRRHVTPQQPHAESAVLVVPPLAGAIGCHSSLRGAGSGSAGSWLHHTSWRASEPPRVQLEAAMRP
jgi:hypothetical protein